MLASRSALLPRLTAVRGRVPEWGPGVAVVIVSVLIWARFIWVDAHTPDFQWRAWDYHAYVGAASAFWAGHPYQPAVNVPLVPYPPLFAWSFTPFMWLQADVGFVVWSALNVLAAAYLCFRIAQLRPGPLGAWTACLVALSFPVVFTLLTGQLQIWLACAMAECYLSLRGRHDFRAGVWLSCLLFKPQYGILLGLLLVWKRRWLAVLGSAIGALVVFGASAMVAGLPSLVDFLQAVAGSDGAGPGAPSPRLTNFRQLTWWIPSLAGVPWSLVLTLALSGLVVVGAVLIWRGGWNPSDPRFPSRVALVLITTQLAVYHTDAYGPVTLALPLAAVLLQGLHSRWTAWAVAALAVLPTLVFGEPDALRVREASTLLTVLLVVCYAALFADLRGLSVRQDPAR